MVGSATMPPGEEGSVTLEARSFGKPGLGAWSVDIAYDTSVVAAVSCNAEHGGICNPTYAPDTVRVAGATATGIEGDATLATITFRCVDEGSSVLSVIPNVIADATIGDPQPLEPATQDGSVTCAAAQEATPTPGSTTGDLDCDDFEFQQDAQAVLDSDPSDPHQLDHPDNDGVACEDLPRRGSAPGTGALPSAGSGGWQPDNFSNWLIAALVGAGLAWLVAGLGAAGISLPVRPAPSARPRADGSRKRATGVPAFVALRARSGASTMAPVPTRRRTPRATATDLTPKR